MYFNVIKSHSHSLKSKGATKSSFDAYKWYIQSTEMWTPEKSSKMEEEKESWRKKYFIKNYFTFADGEWKCSHCDFTKNTFTNSTMETANIDTHTHKQRDTETIKYCTKFQHWIHERQQYNVEECNEVIVSHNNNGNK